eukprot:4184395-Pyramimonas_sp.AAC.1
MPRGAQRLEALGRRLVPTMWGSGGSESHETPNCLSFHGVPRPRNQTMAAHVRLYTRLLASVPTSTSRQ